MAIDDPAVKSVYRTFSGPWHGDSQIVVGIDIGTTYSGVAFTFLQKGAEQLLHRVDQWPGQQNQSFNGKIPTLVWYSKGKAMSFGAEALTFQTKRDAEEHGWQLAEHFKLRLHPSELRASYNLTTDPLPDGVSLDQVYTDFLRYLFRHIQPCFERVISDGEAIWEKYRPDAIFVIAHPNGWGITEQAFLRNAAVSAGLTTTEKAAKNIRFVTEAEASVHFCMHYTNLKSCLHPGSNFAVCDAGGSTVDTTVYTVEKTHPRLRLSEVRGSACVQAGAIFVDRNAKRYLCQLFKDAELSSDKVDEYVTQGMSSFESQEKRRFSQDTTEACIEVAGSRYKNPRINIKYGVLSLSGTIVRSFFDPCVNDILASVSSQISSTKVPYILLVGGFGGSPYLRQRLQTQFSPSTGCQVMTTNEASSKAVADGAVIWHCAESVFKRAPRLAYGTDVIVPFDPTNPEHCGRKQCEKSSGTHVEGAWSEIVAKDVPIDSDAVSRQSFCRQYRNPNPYLGNISDDIFGYSFAGLSNWVTTKSGEINDGFRKVCSVSGDLGGMRNALQPRTNASGTRYWTLSYDICIRFGRTEFEAYLEWVEGVSRLACHQSRPGYSLTIKPPGDDEDRTGYNASYFQNRGELSNVLTGGV